VSPSSNQGVISFAFEPYVNYLLSRLQEAAEKLQSTTAPRIAVAILESYDFSYEFPFSKGMIDLLEPSYIFNSDSEKNEYFAKFPTFSHSLNLISTLDEIWIFSCKNEFKLCLEHQIQVCS
jgi:hypothetical protein